MGYAFVVLIQSQGNLAVVEEVLLVRGVLSPAAHMAWTGLTAAALWRAAERGWTVRAIGGFVGGVRRGRPPAPRGTASAAP
jgi:RsiW-degrading membrane proteinase PrsW (M82 family)